MPIARLYYDANELHLVGLDCFSFDLFLLPTCSLSGDPKRKFRPPVAISRRKAAILPVMSGYSRVCLLCHIQHVYCVVMNYNEAPRRCPATGYHRGLAADIVPAEARSRRVESRIMASIPYTCLVKGHSHFFQREGAFCRAGHLFKMK